MIALINGIRFYFNDQRINAHRLVIDYSKLSDEIIMTTVPSPPEEDTNNARRFYGCRTRGCERLGVEESFGYCFSCYIRKVRNGEVIPFLLPSITATLEKSFNDDPNVESCVTKDDGTLSIKV